MRIELTDNCFLGGTRGEMVIVMGNGHGDMSSTLGQGCLHFTRHSYPRIRYESNDFLSMGK